MHRGRSDVSRSEFPAESPIDSRPYQTVTIPRGQDRPNLLIAGRSGEDIQRPRTSRRQLDLNSASESNVSGLEETSPTFPVRRIPSVTATPLNSLLSRSNCDHEMRTQLLQLQRQISVLTEKVDFLRDSSIAVTQERSRKSENLPRDLVACVHKVVAKLREKDPPTQWTLEPINSFNDETNGEVTLAVERGVRATSAFKDADPVLLERSIRTYFKTLKARRKRASTQKRMEGQPEVSNELEESVIAARRNQRCHNKLKARKDALKRSSYSEEKKRMLEEVLTVAYMSPEESDYEGEEEEEDNRLLQKIIIRKFQWRSDSLNKEFRSLDRKASRAKSDRARRMTIPREIGAFIPGSLHTYPKEAPVWALNEHLRGNS
ncbi:uncharacterized protein [Montipora foliosa]|uniref:uncharacterized protein n=1 Tax=Montipora foliosa TaxID=591990 RepID=UPI0035F1290F